jgi:hypothetical protein
MASCRIKTELINDWAGFHEVSKEVLGFPDFYGNNMNAWIDCLSDLDEDSRMTRFYLTEGENLNIELEASNDFKARLPEIFDALVECTAFVNQRYIDEGKSPMVELVMLTREERDDAKTRPDKT